MSKKKGTRVERELFHMLWENGWQPLRAAGSGSTTIPSPDILVGNKGKIFAIECKSIKKNAKYFDNEEIEQLKLFSLKFGATPIIGIKFDRIGWYFLPINELKKTKSGFSLSLKLAQEKGLSFNQLIK